MLFLTITLALNVAPVPIELPSGPGAMAPSLATHNNDLILSWLEPGEDGAMSFRLARHADGAWSEPMTIVERNDFFANWADVPMVCPIDDDSLSAFWLQKAGPGTYAYHVVSARSDDGGATWNTSGPVHDDFSPTEHGFVAPIGLPDQDATRVFWLDGRAMTGEGDGHGHGGGGDMQLRTTVLHALPMPSEVLDDRTCECCNTAAAMTSNGPVILYRDRSDDEVRDISIVRQVDGVWTKPESVHDDGWGITACPVNGPAVDAPVNALVVAWYSGVGTSGVVRVTFSQDGGATFGDVIELDESFPVGRVDVEMLDDGSALVCWLDDAGGLPESRGAVQVQRVSADGAKGEINTAARTSLSRRTGFPRMAVVDDAVFVTWTDATGLRAVRIDR